MKTVLPFLLFVCFGKLYSQDYIVKKNGEELFVWIKEISETKISYSYFQSNDSIQNVLNKSDVLLIKFRNGLTEVYLQKKEEPASLPPPLYHAISVHKGGDYISNKKIYEYHEIRIEMHKLGDKGVDSLMNLAKKNDKISILTGLSAAPIGLLALIYSGLADDAYVNDYKGGYKNLFITAIVTSTTYLAVSYIYIRKKILRKKYMRKAVDLYNIRINETEQ